MPDTLDYEWLGWLIAHPDEWTADDLGEAKAIVRQQTRAVEDSDTDDVDGRNRMRAVVAALEPAIEEYQRRHTG